MIPNGINSSRKEESVVKSIYIVCFLLFMSSFVIWDTPVFYFFLGIGIAFVVRTILHMIPIRFRLTKVEKEVQVREEQRLGSAWVREQRLKGISDLVMLFLSISFLITTDMNKTIHNSVFGLGTIVVIGVVAIITLVRSNNRDNKPEAEG